MDSDHFYSQQLGFYIEKPTSWEFLPTAWAENLIRKTAHSNTTMRELLEQAKTPFVFMQMPTSDVNHAIPTVQVSCLSVAMPSNEKRLKLLDVQLEMLAHFEDFTLISKDENALVAGCPAMHVCCEFSLMNEEGSHYGCHSNLWTLFDSYYAYAVGLSGAPENYEEYAEDFQAILKSIRTGLSHEPKTN